MPEPPFPEKTTQPLSSSPSRSQAGEASVEEHPAGHESAVGERIESPRSFIQLGHTTLPLGEARQLKTGSVVPLQQSSQEVAWLIVDGEARAAGVLLEVDGQFAFQVTDVAGQEASCTATVAEEDDDEVQ